MKILGLKSIGLEMDTQMHYPYWMDLKKAEKSGGSDP